MNILHIIPGIDPRSGGPQYALRRLVQGQVALGHRVSVFTTAFQTRRDSMGFDDYLTWIRSDPAFVGANLVITPSWCRLGAFRNFSFAPRAVRCFRDIMCDPAVRPDVVHLHEIFSYVLAISASRARRFGVPYLITPHGSLDKVCYQSGHFLLKKLFAAVWLKDNLMNSRFLHVTSEFEAAQVSHLDKWIANTPIRIIPLGAELPQYDSQTARAEFSKRFPQVNGRRYILHLARIHRIKRLEVLVRAMARLPEDFQDVVLVVAGQDAGHLATVKRVVDECGLADRVFFLGFVSGATKQGAIEAARVFALPSGHENHGVSVLEALMHGIPAIVTPQVASHKYVEDTGCGLIVEGTPEAFADAITRVLRNPNPYFEERTIEELMRLLSWDRVLSDFDALYSEMATSSKTPVIDLRPAQTPYQADGE